MKCEVKDCPNPAEFQLIAERHGNPAFCRVCFVEHAKMFKGLGYSQATRLPHQTAPDAAPDALLGKRRPYRQQRPTDEIQAWFDHYQESKSLRATAAHFGIDYNEVYRLVRQLPDYRPLSRQRRTEPKPKPPKPLKRNQIPLKDLLGINPNAIIAYKSECAGPAQKAPEPTPEPVPTPEPAPLYPPVVAFPPSIPKPKPPMPEYSDCPRCQSRRSMVLRYGEMACLMCGHQV